VCTFCTVIKKKKVEPSKVRDYLYIKYLLQASPVKSGVIFIIVIYLSIYLSVYLIFKFYFIFVVLRINPARSSY
jgi:hypothetical protein